MTVSILVAGCGALGSRIAMEIAAPGVRLTLLDFDTVNENNVTNGTSAFNREALGARKTEALASMSYRRYRQPAQVWNATLNESNAHRLLDFDLVVDAFDNVTARQLTTIAANVLHVGVSAGDSGGCWWNEQYPMPTEVSGPPVCTNALGRTLLRVTATLAATCVEEWMRFGSQRTVVTTTYLRIMG